MSKPPIMRLIQEDTCSLSNADGECGNPQFRLSFPYPITEQEYEDFKEWMELITRKLGRFIEKSDMTDTT